MKNKITPPKMDNSQEGKKNDKIIAAPSAIKNKLQPVFLLNRCKNSVLIRFYEIYPYVL